MPTIEEILILAETKGIDKAREEIKDLSDSTKKADAEGEKYTKTLGDMSKEANIMGVSMNSLSSGFKSSVGSIKASAKGLGAFRLALASTGIGLIVIALGSFVAWLKTTTEGIEFMNGVLIFFGEVLGKATEALVRVFKGLQAIAKGDFSTGFQQIATSFDGIGESIANATREAIALDKAMRALEVRTASNNVAIAQYRRFLAENKRALEDVTIATGERLKAAEKAAENLANIGRVEKQLAAEATRIARKQLLEAEEGTEARRLAGIAFAEIAAAEIDLETANIEQSIELQNKINTLKIQFDQEETERARIRRLTNMEDLQGQAKGVEDLSKKENDARKKALKDIKIFYKNKGVLAADDFEQRQKIEEETVGLVKSTLTAIGTAIGVQGQAAKAMAVFQGTLDVALAIGKAIASAPWPANIPAVANAVTAGAGLIATIRSASQPPVPQYGEGGLVVGPSHSDGGVMANLEGGETVINARSSKMFSNELSAMNVAGGGIPFMQLGGVIPQATGQSPFRDLELALAQQRTVLVTEDLNQVQAATVVSELVTTF